MSFIPDGTPAREVPYFEKARAESGWQGQASKKTIEQLKEEVRIALARLGGSNVIIQAGKFQIGDRERLGFQISYSLSNGDKVVDGRLNVAALPTKANTEAVRTGTLKMALYMTRVALEGAWFLEQLSPGYAALLPWMLDAKSGETLTEMWTQKAGLGNLLPPGKSEDFIEGEYKVKK